MKFQMDTGTVVNKQISCEEMLSKTKECVQMDIGRRKKNLTTVVSKQRASVAIPMGHGRRAPQTRGGMAGR
jgi:hypothetical protein